ncbi:branched-chain amino acid ABC transporter permease [Ancylobacter sp. Lp-2]|uniref:branched-chain amino acid ABC transporter permease n=1 Tax=Ancylobacter sp. Lp-2 TaxID=2881339 RepID=UPI001E4BDD1F|nr:branched-chain amino acid ABC transporter permease [Ancylobacter sp. Lp-2]MCB4768334.1 branched-chain amino acid ABC transporter permease [Ancylobacter sp. Lp-2]
MLDFAIYCLTIIAVWSVLGLSLNIQFGLTGLVNFGQVLPFGLGAYAAALAAQAGLPWPAGAALGLVVAVAVSLLVLLPARRLSQDYWALITLGAGELFRLTALNAPSLGGADGLTVPRFADPHLALGAALALMAVAWLMSHRIAHSPFGRLLKVLREDEVLAATLGRNPVAYQRTVSIIAWAMAAAGGVLYAHIVGYVSPSSFTVTETFIVWTALILGGPGNNLGVVVGAAAVQLLSVSSRFVASWIDLPADVLANGRLALFGLVLVLMFLFRPQGLVPEKKEVRDAQRR